MDSTGVQLIINFIIVNYGEEHCEILTGAAELGKAASVWRGERGTKVMLGTLGTCPLLDGWPSQTWPMFVACVVSI